MTVSGVTTAHTPFPTIVPHSPAAPVARSDRPERPRSGFDELTEPDRALIQHVTGQRIGPGFDPSAEPVSPFAATIAAERAAGHLAPGQEVTGVYLKDLDRRFQRTGRNPIGPHLAKAVDYLRSRMSSHFDVSA